MTTHDATSSSAQQRRVFMILSPRSLSYARYALESLLRNCQERIHLFLITDSAEDRQLLIDEMKQRQKPGIHEWSVSSEADLNDSEASVFAKYPNLRLFRKGHPCWRKITDPLLMSAAGEEMVLLDPDIYFPNQFLFEPTPDSGLLLMWQRPNCLLPARTVNTAIANGIPLAHHVDIGVAHWRASVDLDWLEWLLVKLDCPTLPRVMHVEAIVWAALAMRVGGGHLDPVAWHCWHRSQSKRVRRKLGTSGVRLLRSEPFNNIKCFHAGGEAKSWLAEAKEAGILEGNNVLFSSTRVFPFREITPGAYRREQRMKSVLRTLGYYAAFDSA